MAYKALAVFCSAAIVAGVFSEVPSRTERRIVGGTEVAENEISWQVSIQFNDNNDHWCGGSIISENYIVTTARCSTYNPRNMRVVAGTIEWKKPGSVHNVTQVIDAPGWWVTQGNDISLWKVHPPFIFNSSINAIQLPAPGAQAEPGTVMTVSGWGITSWAGPRSDILLKVDVPIVSKSDCNASYLDLGGIGADEICAGRPEGGVDACNYDTGGPLFLDGVLYGIYSWGYFADCAVAGYPGVYTEVSAFRDLIYEVTGV